MATSPENPEQNDAPWWKKNLRWLGLSAGVGLAKIGVLKKLFYFGYLPFRLLGPYGFPVAVVAVTGVAGFAGYKWYQKEQRKKNAPAPDATASTLVAGIEAPGLDSGFAQAMSVLSEPVQQNLRYLALLANSHYVTESGAFAFVLAPNRLATNSVFIEKLQAQLTEAGAVLQISAADATANVPSS